MTKEKYIVIGIFIVLVMTGVALRFVSQLKHAETVVLEGPAKPIADSVCQEQLIEYRMQIDVPVGDVSNSAKCE